jgi:branched-chain amino acid transport system ATP-binding protein
MSAPLLELRGLSKRFGALVVTDKVSLTVEAGEVHALIGPNGAGKSCLIAQITGELVPDAGDVLFKGERLNGVPVHRRVQRGLVRAYQVPRLFGSLTAEENTSVAVIARTRTGFEWWSPAARDRTLARASAEMLKRVGLGAQARRPSALLAHGEKRQLELATGLASEPAMLLLDEPLAGLGPGDSGAMIELLRTLKGRYGIMLVEHDMAAVFALADRISVLEHGGIIASGAPEAIKSDPAVKAAYLGYDATAEGA